MIPHEHLNGHNVLNMVIGESRNFNHDQCPAGADHRGRLSVLRKASDLWLVYCYNCGDGNALRFGGKAVDSTDVLAMLTKHLGPDEPVVPDVMVKHSKIAELPKDIAYHPAGWDVWAHERLWRHHTTASVVTQPPYAWGFSPSRNQLIIPIVTGERDVLGYQARQHPDRKPKCITTYFQGNNGKPLLYHAEGSDVLFIVEDPLSAVRLHRECNVNVMAILGTHVSNATLVTLIQTVNRHAIESINIWLDDDNAGKTAAGKAFERISPLYSSSLKTQVYVRSCLEPKQILSLKEKVSEWISPS